MTTMTKRLHGDGLRCRCGDFEWRNLNWRVEHYSNNSLWIWLCPICDEVLRQDVFNPPSDCP